MKYLQKTILAASISLCTLGVSAEPKPYMGVAGVNLPGVKLSTVRDPVVQEITEQSEPIAVDIAINNRIAPVSSERTSSLTDDSGKRPEQYPLDITVSPGVNELISVSKGYPNRVLTPFEDPVVDTLSSTDFTFQKKGSVLLISPKSERPVGIFIRENGEYEKAISLTLIPKAIPPREIHLKFDGSASQSKTGTRRAKTWEQSLPFVEILGGLYIDLIQGRLPSGYSMEKPEVKDVYQFNCDFGDAPVFTTLEQLVEGGDLRVGVLSAFNNSDVPLELREASCDNFGVASVAFYPPVISPKSYSEVFIVAHRQTTFDDQPTRPSVIPVQAR